MALPTTSMLPTYVVPIVEGLLSSPYPTKPASVPIAITTVILTGTLCTSVFLHHRNALSNITLISDLEDRESLEGSNPQSGMDIQEESHGSHQSPSQPQSTDPQAPDGPFTTTSRIAANLDGELETWGNIRKLSSSTDPADQSQPPFYFRVKPPQDNASAGPSLPAQDPRHLSVQNEYCQPYRSHDLNDCDSDPMCGASSVYSQSTCSRYSTK